MSDKNFFPQIKGFLIDNITFTQRELDVMSCILCGRNTKSTSSFLSNLGKQISQRSVDTHIANIRRKVNASSRSSIIEFLEERPHSYELIRQHYYFLRRQIEVDQLFKKKFFGLNLHSNKKVLILFHEKDTIAETITEILNFHLSVLLNSINITKFSDPSIKSFSDIYYYDCVVLISLDSKNNIILKNLRDYKKDKGNALSLIVATGCPIEKIDNEEIQFILLPLNCEYYEAFFLIASKILETDDLIELYHRSLPSSQVNEQTLPKTGAFTKFSSVKYPVLTTTVLLLLFTLLFYFIKVDDKDKIHYDMQFPPTYMMIGREHIQEKIQFELDKQLFNRSITIIGPSGSGKSVIARRFAKKQKNIDIIWEINAENTEKIKTSFEQLAFALAKGEEEKFSKKLSILPSAEARNRLILDFVKQKLLTSQRWILIYNNATQNHSFAKYYPLDPYAWGRGTFIVTTQDGNFQKNHLTNSSILVPPLNEEEKLELFTKVLAKSLAYTEHNHINDAIKSYLKNIPPYPLDIEIASHYFGVTNSYIDNDNITPGDKALYQDVALKNFGVQTREQIISHELDAVLKENSRLIDIIFLVSILEHRNIPKLLLDSCSEDLGYEYFIYQLNKYSILEINSNYKHDNFNINPTIQAMIRKYCFENIPASKLSSYFQKFYKVCAQVTESLIGAGTHKIKEHIAHFQAILSYKHIMDTQTHIGFLNRIGDLYLEINDYVNAKKFLEMTLELGHNLKIPHKDFEKLLTSLGIVYEAFGDYYTSLKMLKKSAELQDVQNVKDIFLLTQTKSFLGLANLELGSYKESKNTLEEVLRLGRNFEAWQNSWVHARALYFLAAVNRVLGEYKKASLMCEQSLAIYKKYFPEDTLHSASTELQVAMIKLGTGENHEAGRMLERIYNLYNSFYAHDHPNFGLLFIQMGILYKNIGVLQKAELFLKKAYENTVKNYGQHHIRLGWIANLQSELSISTGKYEQAEKYITEAEQIYNAYKHPSYHYTLLNKAKILIYKYKKSQQDVTNKVEYLQQIEKLLAQSKEIIIKTYPSNTKRERLLTELLEVELKLSVKYPFSF